MIFNFSLFYFYHCFIHLIRLFGMKKSSLPSESTVSGSSLSQIQENKNENSMTAIIHAGADLFLRTAYCPDKFNHRVVFLR